MLVSMSDKPIERVVEEHAPRWLELPGVVGVGVGQSAGKRCIKVFVAQSDDRTLAELPHSIEGWPVVVDNCGDIRALESDAADS
jgi:hypothetical protein